MARLAVLGLLAIAACGRLDFAPRPDAGAACGSTNLHDEDGDGLVDDCDPCPHVSGDAADADGDGVGDACDPSATTAARIALFDPFISQRTPPWTFPTSEIDGDDLLLNGLPPEGIDSDLPVGAGLLTAAGLVTPVGSGLHQFSYGVEEGSNIGGYFCEVFANAGTFYVSATYTLDKTNYVTSPRPIPGGIDTGGEMRLSMINTPPTWQCELAWRGNLYTTPVTSIPPSLAATNFGLSVNGADLRLHYFVQIASP